MNRPASPDDFWFSDPSRSAPSATACCHRATSLSNTVVRIESFVGIVAHRARHRSSSRGSPPPPRVMFSSAVALIADYDGNHACSRSAWRTRAPPRSSRHDCRLYLTRDDASADGERVRRVHDPLPPPPRDRAEAFASFVVDLSPYSVRARSSAISASLTARRGWRPELGIVQEQFDGHLAAAPGQQPVVHATAPARSSPAARSSLSSRPLPNQRALSRSCRLPPRTAGGTTSVEDTDRDDLEEWLGERSEHDRSTFEL